MTEEEKARQELWDARKQNYEVKTMSVLTPALLARIRTLPRGEQVKFMRALDVIRTFPKEMYEKAFVELCSEIFIRS